MVSNFVWLCVFCYYTWLLDDNLENYIVAISICRIALYFSICIKNQFMECKLCWIVYTCVVCKTPIKPWAPHPRPVVCYCTQINVNSGDNEYFQVRLLTVTCGYAYVGHCIKFNRLWTRFLADTALYSMLSKYNIFWESFSYTYRVLAIYWIGLNELR